MTVSSEDKIAMARLLQIMEGKTPDPVNTQLQNNSIVSSAEQVVLAGPGQVTQRDVQAMADVLKKLNGAISDVSANMVTESQYNNDLKEALVTSKNSDGVKIGAYQIKINQNDDRMVNKQSFSVINKLSGETIAHELGLYEAAHGLVKLLNAGNFVNSIPIRELLESEAAYTSHKMDAIRYKRRMKKAQITKDSSYDLYEARRQNSTDRAMIAKAKVKKIYESI